MDEEKESEDYEDLFPAPRSNAAAAIVEGKVYLFGGHGGYNYRRVAFQDMWCFNLATGKWNLVPYTNNPCEARGGHSIFAIGHYLYIYGGWSLDSQFSDLAR